MNTHLTGTIYWQSPIGMDSTLVRSVNSASTAGRRLPRRASTLGRSRRRDKRARCAVIHARDQMMIWGIAVAGLGLGSLPRHLL
jgi:hypothetical protein